MDARVWKWEWEQSGSSFQGWMGTEGPGGLMGSTHLPRHLETTLDYGSPCAARACAAAGRPAGWASRSACRPQLPAAPRAAECVRSRRGRGFGRAGRGREGAPRAPLKGR